MCYLWYSLYLRKNNAIKSCLARIYTTQSNASIGTFSCIWTKSYFSLPFYSNPDLKAQWSVNAIKENQEQVLIYFYWPKSSQPLNVSLKSSKVQFLSFAFESWENPTLVIRNQLQVDLVIRGFFICEFAYSHLKHWSKSVNFLSKCAYLSSNSILEVKKRGTYLPRIMRPTCAFFLIYAFWIFHVTNNFCLFLPHLQPQLWRHQPMMSYQNNCHGFLHSKELSCSSNSLATSWFQWN